MSSLLTPAEQSSLLVMAYELQTDRSAEKFLAKIERVLLDKMFQSSETERALGLSPK
jgi:hypothetical protein